MSETTAIPGLTCRLTLDLPMAGLSRAKGRRGVAHYDLGPRDGMIGFAFDHLGMVRASGKVGRFAAQAVVPSGGGGAMIELELDTASVAFSAQHELLGRRALRGMVRFRSTACELAGPDRWNVRGLLEVLGVTRLLTLSVAVTGRQTDPITQTQVVAFVATATLQPSLFGWAATSLLTHAVEVKVHAQVECDVSPPG